MMRLDKKTILFLSGFIAYAIFVLKFYNNFVSIMANSNVFIAIGLYILLNPAYMIIIYGIFTRYKARRPWKRIIASVLSVLALDFLAVPRIGFNEALNNGSSTIANIGGIVIRSLEPYLGHGLAYYAMYLVIPVIMLMMAIELLGITNFIREVKR